MPTRQDGFQNCDKVYSAVVHVLIRIILFHRDVFQESYNSLKMAQDRLKVAPAVFCMAVYLRVFVSMVVRHIVIVKAQVKHVFGKEEIF